MDTQPQNIQQPQKTQAPYADGFWQFNQYIVDPKAESTYSHITRDIKLSNLDTTEKSNCLLILRRIARLKAIGDYPVQIKMDQYKEITEEQAEKIEPNKITLHEEKKFIKERVPAVDEYGEPLFELKNKFPKALEIYINDLFSIVTVASATDGFERKALTTQITKGSQHFIEETRDKQKKEWFKFFPKKGSGGVH